MDEFARHVLYSTRLLETPENVKDLNLGRLRVFLGYFEQEPIKSEFLVVIPTG